MRKITSDNLEYLGEGGEGIIYRCPKQRTYVRRFR